MKSLIWLPLLAVVLPAASPDDSVPEKLVDPTGFCYRQIQARSTSGVSGVRYEMIIVTPSSSRYNDVVRGKALDDDGFVTRNPHLEPYVWHGAWVNDRFADFTTGPNCGGLPQIKAD